MGIAARARPAAGTDNELEHRDVQSETRWNSLGARALYIQPE